MGTWWKKRDTSATRGRNSTTTFWLGEFHQVLVLDVVPATDHKDDGLLKMGCQINDEHLIKGYYLMAFDIFLKIFQSKVSKQWISITHLEWIFGPRNVILGSQNLWVKIPELVLVLARSNLKNGYKDEVAVQCNFWKDTKLSNHSPIVFLVRIT